MNGPLAQLIALTCTGNVVFRGAEPEEFFPDNTTCKFCDEVAFVVRESARSGEVRESEIAASPQDWFELCRSQQFNEIRLHYSASQNLDMPEHVATAFLGGGTEWWMELAHPVKSSEVWAARWTLNKNASGSRNWRVKYIRYGHIPKAVVNRPLLSTAMDRLATVVSEAMCFDKKHECGFVDYFSKAIDSLKNDDLDKNGPFSSMSFAQYVPMQVSRLLDACLHAWVFGGMGWWNDQEFSIVDEEVFDRISRELYATLIECVLTATNHGYRDKIK